MTRTVVVPPQLISAPPRGRSTEQAATTAQNDGHRVTVAAVHQLIVQTAVLAVPGAAWVSITEHAGGSLQTVIASDDFARSVDAWQADAGEGPCLSVTLATTPEVHSVDLAHDARWPTFGKPATRAGVGSILSLPLLDRRKTVGALNLYGSSAHAFTDSDQQVGRMLAAQAAYALAAVGRRDNLEIALASRDVIGQAKGILMSQNKITADQAFRLLVETSTTTNRKLRDIAEHLTATGELPGRRTDHPPR